MDNVGARLWQWAHLRASALFPSRNADRIYAVSCRHRAFLPRSACRRTARLLVTCSLKASPDGTASPSRKCGKEHPTTISPIDWFGPQLGQALAFLGAPVACP